MARDRRRQLVNSEPHRGRPAIEGALGTAILLREFSELHRDRALVAIANYRQPQRCARLLGSDAETQLAGVIELLTVDADDHVALFETGIRSGTVRLHGAHKGASCIGKVECLRHLRVQILNADTEITSDDAATINKLRHHVVRKVHWNGESHTLVAAGAPRKNGGVDAHQFAAHVDQGAARVSGVDGGVRLDEVLVVLDPEVAASGRTDNAHRYCLSDAERITDRQDDIADFDVVRVTQRQHWEITCRDLENGDVRLRIRPDQIRFEAPFIREVNIDFVSTFDDVVIRNDITLLTDDDARPGTLASARGGLIGERPKAGAEKRCIKMLPDRRAVLRHRHGDAHNGG